MKRILTVRTFNRSLIFSADYIANWRGRVKICKEKLKTKKSNLKNGKCKSKNARVPFPCNPIWIEVWPTKRIRPYMSDLTGQL